MLLFSCSYLLLPDAWNQSISVCIGQVYIAHSELFSSCLYGTTSHPVTHARNLGFPANTLSDLPRIQHVGTSTSLPAQHLSKSSVSSHLHCQAISISAWTVASLLDSLLSICPCPTSTSFPQGHVRETHSDSLYLSPAWCLSQAFLQSRQSDISKSEDLWCHWPHSRQPWLLGKRTACLQSQKAGVSSHVC